eukprot:220425-Rhodomonas_salina.1
MLNGDRSRTPEFSFRIRGGSRATETVASGLAPPPCTSSRPPCAPSRPPCAPWLAVGGAWPG